MQLAHTAAALRGHVRNWRERGARVAFVPTMGNLHEGHFSLLHLARSHADRVVASIFVNPTQFGPGEDFDRYPRTPQSDRDALVARGCDLLFAPPVDEIYPFGIDGGVRVQVPALGDILEGASRPGHFSGVATVVAKLFNLVQPDLAVFGQKDYQQWLVVRRMVEDLRMPLRVLAAPTLREADGLAMSSRNQYLDAAQRPRAAALHQALLGMSARLVRGASREDIERSATESLQAAGMQVDYAVLRNREDLSVPAAGERSGLVALVAAKLGRTRLIDNLLLDD